MSYTGGHLIDFYPPASRKLPAIQARRMADRGGEVMTDKVQRKTPVQTGRTRASMKQKRTKRRAWRGAWAYESGTYSELLTALWLEYGTRPHLIRSQSGTLAFDIGGRRVYAREVHHPGTKGQHMFAIAAAETEAEFMRITRPYAEEWARLAEAMVVQRPG